MNRRAFLTCLPLLPYAAKALAAVEAPVTVTGVPYEIYTAIQPYESLDVTRVDVFDRYEYSLEISDPPQH